MIIDHNHPRYQIRWENSRENRFNGAYYYSQEIVSNIIPRVKTDRNWVTLNIPGLGCNHAIVFIHNNLNPDRYEWLKTYGFKDLILVCGIPETCEKVAHLGTPIYLPLSIDTEYVMQFKREQTKDIAYAGRRNKISQGWLPGNVPRICNMEREDLLRSMAKYRRIYAVGRTAIEAAALGCKIEAYDYRFPDPSIWKVIDNRTAAAMLQTELNKIDK